MSIRCYSIDLCNWHSTITFQILLLDETHRTFFMETGKQMITGLMVKANKVKRFFFWIPPYQYIPFCINRTNFFLFWGCICTAVTYQFLHCLLFFAYIFRVPKPSWRATRICCFTPREKKRGPSLRWSWRDEGWVVMSLMQRQQGHFSVTAHTGLVEPQNTTSCKCVCSGSVRFYIIVKKTETLIK